jgi:hypothetical protein
MFNSLGWVLLGLTWIWLFEYVWGSEMSCEDRPLPTCEVQVCPKLPENRFVIKSFEKNQCKTETDQTFVWQTVERIKVDTYPIVNDNSPVK